MKRLSGAVPNSHNTKALPLVRVTSRDDFPTQVPISTRRIKRVSPAVSSPPSTTLSREQLEQTVLPVPLLDPDHAPHCQQPEMPNHFPRQHAAEPRDSRALKREPLDHRSHSSTKRSKHRTEQPRPSTQGMSRCTMRARRTIPPRPAPACQFSLGCSCRA